MAHEPLRHSTATWPSITPVLTSVPPAMTILGALVTEPLLVRMTVPVWISRSPVASSVKLGGAVGDNRGQRGGHLADEHLEQGIRGGPVGRGRAQ